MKGCDFLRTSTTPESYRPNVLFILTDQQNFRMLSCTGNPHVHTPNLDRLAAAGARFEQAYVTHPVCVPSRLSFQTGRMPSEFGVYCNRSGFDLDPEFAQSPEVVDHQIGHLMRNAGYETAFAGKTHFCNGLNPHLVGYEKHFTQDDRMEMAHWCVDYLHQPKDRPFFLFASFINPHDVYRYGVNAQLRAEGKDPVTDPAAQIIDALIETAKQSGDLNRFIEEHCPPLPDNFGVTAHEPEYERLYQKSNRRYTPEAHWDERNWRLRRWAYARLTERVDAEIGVLLDGLRTAGLEDDTLILFTSDHGDMDAAHGCGEKRYNYEESAHVPFIVVKNGDIAPGQIDRTHLISSGLDHLPTIFDYAGIPLPPRARGQSLRPVLEDQTASWRDYVVMESEHSRMVRSGPYKYCVYSGGTPREMLLHLDTDPGEMNNLAGDPAYTDVLNAHRALLANWVKHIGDSAAARYLIPPQ